MPRQLTHVVLTKVSSKRINARFSTVYGEKFSDMTRYITDKYGIYPGHVRAIVNDIFRYIEMETLGGQRGIFTIPRFGRFERRDIQGGIHGKSTVLRFTRAAVRRGGTYIDFEDEEWLDE